MSAVPAEIAGIGSTQQKLRVSPVFDPLKASVGPEEYFVLSRIDGKQTLREVLLTTGLPVDRTVAIVSRLRSIGALLLPGEASPPVHTPISLKPPILGRTPTPQVTRRASAGTMPPPPPAPKPLHDLTLPATTTAELAALAENVELDDTDRRRILAIARLVEGRDAHAILG
ncbi:MAG: hypothetical protein WKG01_41600, partial [Kofleriaceae bacterium]